MTGVARSNPLLARDADDGQANDAALTHVASRIALPVAKALAAVSGFHAEVTALPGSAIYGDWQCGAASTAAYRIGSTSVAITVEDALTGFLVERQFGGAPTASPFKTAGQCRVSAALAKDISELVIRAIADAWPGGEMADVVEMADATRFARATDTVPTVKLFCGEIGEIRIAFAIEGVARIGDAPMPPRIAGWEAQLRSSAMSARVCVRAILARPQFSSAIIMRLAIGDVLPIPKPSTVPLFAGAHRIATGVLTDRDGRTALKIETMETLRND